MTTRVAIALVAHRGRYLVGRRGPDGPLAGYYEFPGGKCKPGEPPETCVVRECREETGLDIRVVRLRREVLHAFPYGTVHLHFFDCQPVSDNEPPALRSNFTWVPQSKLSELTFPEPNGPLIAELVAELQ